MKRSLFIGLVCMGLLPLAGFAQPSNTMPDGFPVGTGPGVQGLRHAPAAPRGIRQAAALRQKMPPCAYMRIVKPMAAF